MPPDLYLRQHRHPATDVAGSREAEARILRHRQAGLLAAMDRAVGEPPQAVDRRLVKVDDGGAMPTLPDHVYFTHPVELDGDECEGCEGTPAVYSDVTLPVVVLWSKPGVGDLLVATMVGGRWVAERSRQGTPTPSNCNDCTFPEPMPLTDSNGTINLFKISSTPPIWKGSYYLTMASGTVVDIDGLGSCYWSGTSSSGPVTICYTVTCNANGTMTVTRSWSVVSTRFTNVWIPVQDTSTPAPTSITPCPTSPAFFCQLGRILTDKSEKSAMPEDCDPDPFAWSKTLDPDAGNKTSDPVGGTVALG